MHTTAVTNILEGPKYEPALQGVSLGELTLLMLNNHGEYVVQVDAETGEELTACLLLNRAVCLAKWLRSRNIGVGDAISINSENRLEFCTVPIACFLIGATFAPLNPDYTPGELKHVMNLTKPKVIFCSEKTIHKVISVLPEHPYIESLVLLGKCKNSLQNVILLDDILKDIPEGIVENHNFIPEPVNPEETVATVLCSSGTTGLPKGVMCTHANMTSYMDIARHILSHFMNSDYDADVKIGLAPFFHSMGFMIMYLNIMSGRKMVVFSKFSPEHFLEALQKYKITRIQVPPPIIIFLIKHPMVKHYDLSNLKEIISGAAPLSKDVEQAALKRFPCLTSIIQGYGMTETTLSVLLNPPNKPKSGSVGLLVPGMKGKVIDESGKALGPHEEGELCFKGPLIMKGYIGDEDSTAKTIDREGWLHTGDVGYYDTDGYFFIVDRLKELIKYKAFQVAPAELEAILIEHPGVADAAVVGIPDEISGELPLAFIVRKLDSTVSAVELEKFVADKVSPQKKLRGGVYFIDNIPRNPTGKILRRVLRDRAKTLKSKL